MNPENFENSLKSPYKVKMKVGLFFDCGQPLLEISVHSFLTFLCLSMQLIVNILKPEVLPDRSQL